MSENTLKYDFGNFFFKKRSLITLECRNFRLFLRFKKNCDVMEQFWRQIRIQRAKIHKTSLVRSPAQGTFFFVGLCSQKSTNSMKFVTILLKKNLPLEIFVSSFFFKTTLRWRAFLLIILASSTYINEQKKQKYRTVKQKFKLNTPAAALREVRRKVHLLCITLNLTSMA